MRQGIVRMGAVAALVGLALVVPSAARAQSGPEVRFATAGDRTLHFVNNPEQLSWRDLGDADLGDVAIYRASATGKVRVFFEHVNRSGGAIGHGIQLYNPTARAVTVTLRGEGFEASILGGRPFRRLMESLAYSPRTIVIEAGRTAWLQKKDYAVASGAFFSGAVDFDVTGGTLVLSTVAFRSFSRLDGSRAYMGYVTRTEADGTRESRMYKGIASASEVAARNLDFSFTNASTGALTLLVRPFDKASGRYGAPAARRGFVTNVGPFQNASATAQDMVSFDMPGWGLVSPFQVSDATRQTGNLGNWGIVYDVSGTLENRGTRTRRVGYVLKAPSNAGIVFAYRTSTGTWYDARVERGNSAVIYAVSVAPGARVPFRARWVLGGPAGGSIEQSVQLLD